MPAEASHCIIGMPLAPGSKALALQVSHFVNTADTLQMLAMSGVGLCLAKGLPVMLTTFVGLRVSSA